MKDFIASGEYCYRTDDLLYAMKVLEIVQRLVPEGDLWLLGKIHLCAILNCFLVIG